MRAGGAVAAGRPLSRRRPYAAAEATPAGVSGDGRDERVLPRACRGTHARTWDRGRGAERARNGARPKADASAGGETAAGQARRQAEEATGGEAPTLGPEASPPRELATSGARPPSGGPQQRSTQAKERSGRRPQGATRPLEDEEPAGDEDGRGPEERVPQSGRAEETAASRPTRVTKSGGTGRPAGNVRTATSLMCDVRCSSSASGVRLGASYQR